ncbi:MAG: hypothetical protein QGG05_00730 [Candidatus Latescibacteria bacterium]|nr:hypothetical protein [Candidatus Latescibacterota bacterium]
MDRPRIDETREKAASQAGLYLAVILLGVVAFASVTGILSGGE